MRICCLAAFVVLLTAPASLVRADEQTHRQAAEELFKAMSIDKQMENAMDQTLTMQIKAQPALVPYKGVMRKFFAKHISYAALKEDLIKIYTEEFTEEELRQIVTFYKTPAGKKLVEKSPALLGRCMQLGTNRVAKHEDELKQMIEDEVKKQKDKP
ncbi:MAG TPA: DUF2059 domain-containing protein [Gemmataceae bacterium]|nr:DUF2059 domain-containing protein [Gemmataceae bacterium]